MDSVALLERMIAFPTVSRDTNLDLIGFVRDLLAGRGIASTLIGSADNRKVNPFATVGGPGPGGVVLSGHTDVVPIDGQPWTSDPFRMTASQDRDAVGRWIDGQADRAEGRRILAELPQLRRGEGYLWAPSDGVLARVVFPRIRTLDSSRTPQRSQRVAGARTPTVVDLPAIAARWPRWKGNTGKPSAEDKLASWSDDDLGKAAPIAALISMI